MASNLMTPWTDSPNQGAEDLERVTQLAIDVFLASEKPNGTIRGIGWWQTANAYTAIALKDLYSGSRLNYNKISGLLRKCDAHRPGFINEFNDDSLWWAICAIHMYRAGGNEDEWFLQKAKAIWKHVRDSKSVIARGQLQFHEFDMEGGCWWKTRPSGNQINAISTGLFAECALRLAQIETNKSAKQETRDEDGRRDEPSVREYVEAARYSLGWILRTRYRAKQGVVLDGFDLERGRANDWTFTYTTAVTLAVCAILFEMTREEEYMALATHMAWRSMRRDKWVEENGVLTEKGAYGPKKHDPLKNNDAVGFKSVLIRQLVTLYGVIERTGFRSSETEPLVQMIRQFIETNFQSQERQNTDGNGRYGPWWDGPFAVPTSHSQMAVLDIMAAIRFVNR